MSYLALSSTHATVPLKTDPVFTAIWWWWISSRSVWRSPPLNDCYHTHTCTHTNTHTQHGRLFVDIMNQQVDDFKKTNKIMTASLSLISLQHSHPSLLLLQQNLLQRLWGLQMHDSHSFSFHFRTHASCQQHVIFGCWSGTRSSLSPHPQSIPLQHTRKQTATPAVICGCGFC